MPKGTLRLSDKVVLLGPGGNTTQRNTNYGLRKPEQLLSESISKREDVHPKNPGSEESKEMQSSSRFQASNQESQGIFLNLTCTSVPTGQYQHI